MSRVEVAGLLLRTIEAGPLALVKKRNDKIGLSDPDLNPRVANTSVGASTAGAANQSVEIYRGDRGWVQGAAWLAALVPREKRRSISLA